MYTEIKTAWKKFCESLREHPTETIIFKKEKKGPINKRKAKIILKFTNFLYLYKKIEDRHVKDTKYCKVRYYWLYTGKYRDAADTIHN